MSRGYKEGAKRAMNIIELKSNLKRYNRKSKYTLAMAMNLVIDRGYTLEVDSNNLVNHKVMYDGRVTGVSLVSTKKGWFVV